jgi:hypothetical protein
MRIVFTARDVLGLELSGTFSTERVTAETIVSRRLAEYSVAHDRELLEWLRHSAESADNIELPTDSPEEDRMIYVLTDLIARQGDIVVRCSKCNAVVPLDGITSVEKDFSTETAGIRAGFAGELYLCPNQHGLLFSITKIF